MIFSLKDLPEVKKENMKESAKYILIVTADSGGCGHVAEEYYDTLEEAKEARVQYVAEGCEEKDIEIYEVAGEVSQ